MENGNPAEDEGDDIWTANADVDDELDAEDDAGAFDLDTDI